MRAIWRSIWFLTWLASAACATSAPTAEIPARAASAPLPSADDSLPPSGDPAPTTIQPDLAADCPPPAEPGPADDPPASGGDLMDWSDYGGARWRLCLSWPIASSVEGTGSCTWEPARDSVNEVLGHDLRIRQVDYGVWVALSRGEFQLGTIDRARGGLVATYAPGRVQPAGRWTDDGRAGHLTFDVSLMVDPETGPQEGAPPRHAGVVRWICGDPPPPA